MIRKLVKICKVCGRDTEEMLVSDYCEFLIMSVVEELQSPPDGRSLQMYEL